MANSNKKILKLYACGTFFYGFIGMQDNLASYINSDIKNRGEIILQKKIEKIRNQVAEFKKEVEEIESNRKDNNTINQGSLQQYKEKMDKKCRDIQEKIKESLNEAEMLEWKGMEGLKLYKEARNREIKINKNIQEVKKLQNAIDNAIEKEAKKNKKGNINKDIKNNKKTKKAKKTKELSEEAKREIDKKEIRKRERKIEGYKREIKKLKGKINENLKKEEEINVQKEKESVVFNKKINKEKKIAKKNAQVLVKGNNKKISGLEKSLEKLKKKKTNKKNKEKIQKDIEEKKTEIAKLKRKNDDILLNNEKGYDEKIKKFNNKFSVKIDKIKALNIKIQKKIAELENLIESIQREIDIISENGYEYFIKYSKKEKSSKREEVLDNETEEKKEEDLPGEETDKKEKKFDFVTKNKVFGIKNSSISIDSNFAFENKLCDVREWKLSDRSLSIMANGDFYLNFNRANENKIYKKLKFSVDFYWMKDADIVHMFFERALGIPTLYEKGLLNKLEVKYNFYENEKEKVGFKAGYRVRPFINYKEYCGYNFGDTGLFLSFTTKLKKIKTSLEAGVDINTNRKKGVFSLILLTKTKFKYFDLNGYASVGTPKCIESIILRGDIKFKKIKYLEDTLVKVYFGHANIISSLCKENDIKEEKREERGNEFPYIRRNDIYCPIIGISTTYKICLNKMNIFKILGFEKFKCKLNLIVEYTIFKKEDGRQIPKQIYNDVQGKLDLNIGILKLKESRFKKLSKLQVNVFNFALERTNNNDNVKNKGAFFSKFIFDVLVLKYNILKGLSLSLHLFKFEIRSVLKKNTIKRQEIKQESQTTQSSEKLTNIDNMEKYMQSSVSNINLNSAATPMLNSNINNIPRESETKKEINNQAVEEKEEIMNILTKSTQYFDCYWMPSLEIKFDVAKYLLAKKKK